MPKQKEFWIGIPYYPSYKEGLVDAIREMKEKENYFA